MKMIPVFDLARQYDAISAHVTRALERTLSRGMFTLGRETEAFENEFASFVGTKHGVGVASGTDALTLSLRAFGIGEGDEVILPANSYPTAFGVAMAGVRIRLADVLEDGTIDSVSVKKAISTRTKAVIPVHLYGNPADVPSLRRVTGKGIAIIEDAAQAHGAMIRTRAGWRTVGSLGEAGIFSFYPSKNLGAYGDGGMVVTNRRATAIRIRQLRMYGETSRYRSGEVSGVSRLDELQAAILRVKLGKLPAWTNTRGVIMESYRKRLDGIGDIRFVTGMETDDRRPCHHLAVIRTKVRSSLMQHLARAGIGTGIHYPVPIHLTPAFRDLGYGTGDFPVAEALAQSVLSLPLFPELTAGEVRLTTSAIRSFFDRT